MIGTEATCLLLCLSMTCRRQLSFGNQETNVLFTFCGKFDASSLSYICKNVFCYCSVAFLETFPDWSEDQRSRTKLTFYVSFRDNISFIVNYL